MPVRAIIKPAIYSKRQFSCACRAITISLESPSPNKIFHRFGGFRQIRFKNRSCVTFKAMPHVSDKSPAKSRNEIRHSLGMPHCSDKSWRITKKMTHKNLNIVKKTSLSV